MLESFGVVGFAIRHRQPAIHIDDIFVELRMGVGRVGQLSHRICAVDNSSMGNMTTIGDFYSHDHRSNADEAMRPHHRIVHHRFEADERVVAHVARAVNNRVVRDRHILAYVDRPFFVLNDNPFLLQRMKDGSVLNICIRSNEEGRSFIGPHGAPGRDVHMIAHHNAPDNGSGGMNVRALGSKPSLTNVRKPVLKLWRHLRVRKVTRFGLFAL